MTRSSHQRALSPQEIAGDLLTDHFGGGLNQSIRRLQTVETIFAAEALCRQVPAIARATELWSQLPKDENEPNKFVYNDLDCRVSLGLSSDRHRLMLGHENISVVDADAQQFVFWLESDRDLSGGDFTAADLSRLALFRAYPSFETFEADTLLADDLREEAEVFRTHATPAAARHRGGLPRAPSIQDFRAQLDEPEAAPLDVQTPAGLFDMELGELNTRLAGEATPGWIATRSDENGKTAVLLSLGLQLYEECVTFNGTPAQLEMAANGVSGMIPFMEAAAQPNQVPNP